MPTAQIAFIVGLGIFAWLGVTASVILWIKNRKQRREILRLIGRTQGFGLSELEKHPEAVVQYLRADANMCHLAGQKDMSDRLRGYASTVERLLEKPRK